MTPKKYRIILRHFYGIAVVCFIMLNLLGSIETHAESLIAFSSDRHKEIPQIFVMDEQGKNIQQITKTVAYDPIWSPDGKQIICVSEKAEKSYLTSISLDWQDPNPIRQERILSITQGFDFISQPTCSPDGQKIAFIGIKGEKQGLFIIDFLGKFLQKFISLDGFNNLGPAWSPDGKTIALSAKLPGDIFLVDTQTFQLRNITNSPRDEMAVTWSPDGNHLAVSSTEGLLLMSKVGEVIKILTPGKADFVGTKSWSPDGSRLAFSSFVRAGPRMKPEIYVLDLLTQEVTNITNNLAHDSGPAWFDSDFARPVSPAGKQATIWGQIKSTQTNRQGK